MSTKEPDYIDAMFYAQVEPQWSSQWAKRNGDQPDGAKVVRLSQTQPRQPVGGTLLVKLTIRIPASAFMPLRPEAVIVIPESMTQAYPIEVEALDPTDGATT